MGATFSERDGAAWPPVPRCWPGATVAIAAGGPSLTQGQVDAARGKCKLIAINNAYQLAPWADLLYACDAKWWQTYTPTFAGLKVTQDERMRSREIHRIPSVNERGLSLDPARIHQGRNSGYQALNLAVLLGASRILLLGFDLKATDGKRHWHADHPPGLANPSDGLFADWRARFAETLDDLRTAGVTVINCTPDSALRCFPFERLEDAL